MTTYFYIVALALIATCHAVPAADVVPQSVARRSKECLSSNAYYKANNTCDSYIECVEYMAAKKSCPDGLHFDAKAKWPSYPCAYPTEVPCLSRKAQPAKPTAECPHQYGFFLSPSATPDNCGRYRMCVAGRAIEMSCPVGLAFNTASGRCDWPDRVASCNSTEFLGFSCPAAPVDADGQPIDTIINYKYNGNCFYFFSCELGRARLLSCDVGLAFDEVLGRCVDSDLVDCKGNSS